jgi:hypothetical protein
MDGSFPQSMVSPPGLQASVEGTLSDTQNQRYQLRARHSITQAGSDPDIAMPVATPAQTRKRKGSADPAGFVNTLKKIRSSSSFNIFPAGDFTPPPKR